MNPYDVIHAACCALLKQDIPQVQSVILATTPVAEEIWQDMEQDMINVLQEAQDEDLGTEWLAALLVLVDRALVGAPSSTHRRVVRQAATKLGAVDRATAATEDLLLLLRGHVQVRRSELREALRSKPRDDELALAVRTVMRSSDRSWIRVVVDAWAYRWNWVGEVLTARRQGSARRFRYWNPLDDNTSAFCEWLVNSGRIVTIGAVMDQVNRLQQAAINDSIEEAMIVWPLLQFDGSESPDDFNRMFVEQGLVLPPFHWRCRTQIRPIG